MGRQCRAPELIREVEFAPNGDLVVVLDDSFVEANPWRSAIGFITPAQLESGDVGSFGLRTFSDAEGAVSGLRVHHDGTILYSRAGSLWRLRPDGTVRQLTTGPQPQANGVLSPDGTRVALVVAIEPRGDGRQYIVPNHDGAPVYLDPISGAGGEHLLSAQNLVTAVRAWVP